MRQTLINALREGCTKQQTIHLIKEAGGLSEGEAIIYLLNAGVQFGKPLPQPDPSIPPERREALQELSLQG